MVRFSVCIPNFNYGSYISQTIESVLAQGSRDLEVCVSDNASTDNSVEKIRAINDERVKLSVSATNIGFSPNLDRAAGMASGRTLITLSSDDLMLTGAIKAYARLLGAVDDKRCMVGSAIRVIDGQGQRLGRVGAQHGVWSTEHYDKILSERVGIEVYSAPAAEILANSIRRMTNPLPFATTAFPRSLFDQIGGYGGQRLMNPDKWLVWRMLGVAERVYFLNEDLFAYRWHQQNQTAQQQWSGALKFLIDEYASTFQLDDELLRRSEIDREDVIRAFLRVDIGLHGLRDVANGNRAEARRAVHLALATYPDFARQSALYWALRLAATAGPVGTAVAKAAFRPATRLWRRRQRATDKLHETWSPWW